jgi:hypothetical protein
LIAFASADSVQPSQHGRTSDQQVEEEAGWRLDAASRRIKRLFFPLENAAANHASSFEPVSTRGFSPIYQSSKGQFEQLGDRTAGQVSAIARFRPTFQRDGIG